MNASQYDGRDFASHRVFYFSSIVTFVKSPVKLSGTLAAHDGRAGVLAEAEQGITKLINVFFCSAAFGHSLAIWDCTGSVAATLSSVGCAR